MDTLGCVVHEEFSYVHVPADINIPVQVLKFFGEEESFRRCLTTHFQRHSLLPEERDGFERYLKSQYKDPKSKDQKNGSETFELTKNLIDDTINAANFNYQIIPLTLPTKKTNYLAINCYIDGIGRIKNLPKNARATRLCSTDIRGECFVSRTFDDDEAFKRLDFTLEDFEELMANPPDPTGRWDSAEALSRMLNPQDFAAIPTTLESKEDVRNSCENCKRSPKDIPLKICSRCKKVKYCSVECQKKDWPFHRRICS